MENTSASVLPLASQGKKSILFLHGFTQNSDIFQKRLKAIIKTLNKKYDKYNLLFPDAPHILDLEVNYLLV